MKCRWCGSEISGGAFSIDGDVVCQACYDEFVMEEVEDPSALADFVFDMAEEGFTKDMIREAVENVFD